MKLIICELVDFGNVLFIYHGERQTTSVTMRHLPGVEGWLEKGVRGPCTTTTSSRNALIGVEPPARAKKNFLETHITGREHTCEEYMIIPETPEKELSISRTFF
jgi:hypothetical protein